MVRVGGCLIAVVLLLLSVAGCSKPEGPAPESDVPDLPVSLNEVMVALVNDAADPIWVAAWRNPATEGDWRQLERRAFQLQLAGILLERPGTGPNDAAWVANPAWGFWAGRLSKAGADAVSAVKARDLDAIAAAGDDIVEVCEGCHVAFKPDLPTGGVFGELSPTSDSIEVPDYDGRAIYAANCSSCHGTYGEGDGVAVLASFDTPNDLRYLSERNGGEFPTQFVTEIVDGRAARAAHGPVGMPVWGVEFTRMEGFDEQAKGRVAAKIRAIVEFLETLQLTTEN